MLDLLQFEFIRNAIYAAILASIACGIIGSFVVVKRIVFISGGIAHTAFGGIGLGYYLGVNPLLTVFPFSIAAAILLGVMSRKTKISEDSAIGLLWAAGMAIGIILISLTPGYSADLLSYLFGNILTVPKADILLMIGLNIFIVASVLVFYKGLVAITFDEEYAKTRDINTLYYELFLLCLIAITIVILIRVVGIILVISLLTIPALIARKLTNHLCKMMGYAIIISIGLTCVGLGLSYYWNIPSGSVIVLVSVCCYSVLSFIRR